jgi:hypothetical protein
VVVVVVVVYQRLRRGGGEGEKEDHYKRWSWPHHQPLSLSSWSSCRSTYVCTNRGEKCSTLSLSLSFSLSLSLSLSLFLSLSLLVPDAASASSGTGIIGGQRTMTMNRCSKVSEREEDA